MAALVIPNPASPLCLPLLLAVRRDTVSLGVMGAGLFGCPMGYTGLLYVDIVDYL